MAHVALCELDPGLHLCSPALHLCLSYGVFSFTLAFSVLKFHFPSLVCLRTVCFCLNEPFSMQQSPDHFSYYLHTPSSILYGVIYIIFYHTFQSVNYYCLNNFLYVICSFYCVVVQLPGRLTS